ncbi:hypothetical protein V1638_02775 [Pseudarthrobacter sp. J64]|uniref:hypothetical protein n=1 Tax=Pseudarthrobacter sp. J64 TaxID=3116485 RepID=UPI002E7FFD86|nr:hypothetical protein [Pseudarthrobacter sp. J64]MEE2568323.1 hypothetical protein [Pseudarthrobacter sp. J64]
MGAASIVAAAAGFIILVLAGNLLQPAEFSRFNIFWGALFGVFGILSGIQGESTRAVRSAQTAQPTIGKAPSIMGNGLVVGGVAAVLILATSWIWSPAVLGQGTPWLLPALAIAAVAYSGHAAMAGSSAGLQNWSLYARLMSAESVFRLAVVGVVVLVQGTLISLELACIVAAGLWLFFLAVSPSARKAARARADVPRARLMRQTGHAVVSSSATAALIVGFPVILSFTSTPAEIAQAGGLLLAIQLTRAPIMVPLQAFQGVAIASFVNQRDRGAKALRRPTFLLVALGLLGALAAAWAGPWLLQLLFPGKYEVPSWLLAVLTFDAALMAILTLTGTAALAIDAHRGYSLGWLAGTLGSIACLLLPLPLSVRVAVALAVGPVLGILIHIVAIVRKTRGLAPTA